MNKTIKIITVLMLVAMIVFSFSNVSMATDVEITPTQPSSEEISGLTEMAGKVIGLIQIASIVLATVLIAVFGFKFIMGSANEKADYQKSFIPLIVGLVVVFAATSIAKMIMSITGSGS